MAVNALSAQMTRQAPRITSPRARASLPIVDDSNSLRRGRCSPLCKCSCHKFLRASSPSWLQPALGAMSLKYSLISYGRRKPCSSPLCDSRSDTSIDIQYQFPLWLAARAVFCSLSWRSLTGVGASLWLKVPRIVDIDLVTILESSDIETRLSTFQVLPTDIDSKFGLNLLTVKAYHLKLPSRSANICSSLWKPACSLSSLSCSVLVLIQYCQTSLGGK